MPRFPVCTQIKENKDKIKLNNQLPYLVGNVVEVLDVQPEDDEEEDGAAVRTTAVAMFLICFCVCSLISLTYWDCHRSRLARRLCCALVRSSQTPKAKTRGCVLESCLYQRLVILDRKLLVAILPTSMTLRRWTWTRSAAASAWY